MHSLRTRLSSTMAILALMLVALPTRADVVSPTSTEVRFAYESEFFTGDREQAAKELALSQAKFLFGYMQNPQIGPQFGLDANKVGGIGAPRWEPEVSVLGDSTRAGKRTIRYRLSGSFLLHKKVAAKLLADGEWAITLPFDLDHFWKEGCSDPGYPERGDFWYFNFPFQEGCEALREAPLARPVTVRISPAQEVDDLPVGLGDLRGDNGNGDVFQIATINGFDESSTSRQDDGRVNFMAMNAWFRSKGFKMTILSHFRNRPVYLFEKTLKRADGSEVHARVLRLLADSDLDDTTRVTFAKFLKQALEESDVVVYEGHSGLGVNLNLEAVEKQLLLSKDRNITPHVEFNRAKKQVFLFDSCSSYSYYLGMFAGKKDPGTLAVMTNGLESEFGFELPTTKHLYSDLMDLDHAVLRNDGLQWSDVLSQFEKPLRGKTFMLNVDVNNP